jgi:hypothetical protein
MSPASTARWGLAVGDLRALVIAVGLVVSGAAHAAPVYASEAYVTVGGGVRVAGVGAGGVVTLGLGGYAGPAGFEVETAWTNDHSLAALDERTASRRTTWISGLARLNVFEHLYVGLSFGPGLGVIKDAGRPQVPGQRTPSWGLREQLRLELDVSQHDVLLMVGLRLGAEQHFQTRVVVGPEHTFTAMLTFRVGLRGL